MRVCKTCEKVLDNSMFHPCKTGKDGLRIVCKSCVSASQREYSPYRSAKKPACVWTTHPSKSSSINQ